MTVHFIGAGPGDPDLITIKAQRLISTCPVCLYAGSLVPKALLSHCPEGARIINTAVVTGIDVIGETVTDRDQAIVTIIGEDEYDVRSLCVGGRGLVARFGQLGS